MWTPLARLSGSFEQALIYPSACESRLRLEAQPGLLAVLEDKTHLQPCRRVFFGGFQPPEPIGVWRDAQVLTLCEVITGFPLITCIVATQQIDPNETQGLCPFLQSAYISLMREYAIRSCKSHGNLSS